jgi:hypothetical protein
MSQHIVTGKKPKPSKPRKIIPDDSITASAPVEASQEPVAESSQPVIEPQQTDVIIRSARNPFDELIASEPAHRSSYQDINQQVTQWSTGVQPADSAQPQAVFEHTTTTVTRRATITASNSPFFRPSRPELPKLITKPTELVITKVKDEDIQEIPLPKKKEPKVIIVHGSDSESDSDSEMYVKENPTPIPFKAPQRALSSDEMSSPISPYLKPFNLDEFIEDTTTFEDMDKLIKEIPTGSGLRGLLAAYWRTRHLASDARDLAQQVDRSSNNLNIALEIIRKTIEENNNAYQGIERHKEKCDHLWKGYLNDLPKSKLIDEAPTWFKERDAQRSHIRAQVEAENEQRRREERER